MGGPGRTPDHTLGHGAHVRKVLMTLLLRLSGASLLVLSVFHAALWRTFDWGGETNRLSPINRRVFVVHLLFITFVISALGLLSLARPDLLLVPSDLARLLLYAV